MHTAKLQILKEVNEVPRSKLRGIQAKESETPPAGAGGIFNVTSKLGGLQPSRYISRQESGVLGG